MTNVIYILGLGHSGSTLLDLMLGAHSRVTSLGEISKLSFRLQDPPVKNPRCMCGAESIMACAFWEAVQSQLKSKTGMGLRDIDIESAEPARFRRDNTALLNAVRAVSGTEVLVDSSKDRRRMSRLAEVKGVRVVPVFLYRAPHGQINSLFRRDGDLADKIDRNVKTNDGCLHAIERHRDALIVRYETFVAAPAAELQRILSRVDLNFEDAQHCWRAAEHHNIGGNRMRFGTDDRLVLDEAWKHELDDAAKDAVTAATAGIEERVREAEARQVQNARRPEWSVPSVFGRLRRAAFGEVS